MIDWCCRSPQTGWLCFLLAFSPAIVTAWLIAGNAVNVPVWDGWERGVMLEKASSGELDLGYLASAHIDHRPFFPRLITLASNAISGGDVRVEMWIGFLAVLAGAVGLLLVLRKTLSAAGWYWGAMFALNLLIFSPLQYQNFLWAVQLAFLLPLGCLGVLLAVLKSGWKPLVKIAAACALSLFASFSFGHGLILWPVAICMVLLDPSFGPFRSRLIGAGSLLVFGIVVLIGYFGWGYINTSQPWHAYGAEPNQPPPAVDRLENIRENSEKVWAYFWSTLGNPVARLLHSDPAHVSVMAGKWTLGLFAVALLGMFGLRKREGCWQSLLPWAACGMFALTAAVMMASGRGADLPLLRSLLPRYVSLTMYLPIGLIGMVAYLLYHYRHRENGVQWASGLAIALAGLFVGLQSQTYVYGAHKMSAWKTARLEERFQLLYIKHKPPRFPASIDGGMNAVEEGEKPFATRQALFLSGEGLLRPPMFEAFDFGSFTKLSERAKAKGADLTFAQLRADDRLHLAGFATLPSGRIGDGMLVAWCPVGDRPVVPRIERNQSKERANAKLIAGLDWQLLDIMGVQAAPAMRSSFEDGQFGANKMNAAKIENYSRFDESIDISALPAGEEVEITVWVADCERMEVAPLKRSFRMTKEVTPRGEVLVRVD